MSAAEAAVDVVVAEHGDRLTLLDRVGNSAGGGIHVAHAARIGHQRLERGIEHRRHVVRRHAAPRQHAPQQLGQPVPLADGGSAHLAVARQTLAPGESARRCGHAEERRRGGCRLLLPLAHCPHRLAPRA
jgi:hypothetical protein